MTGRPPSYTDELAEAVCSRLANGESLRTICDDDDMPSKDTVRRWRNDNEAFSAQYERAREEQAHCIAEECLHIADTEENPAKARNRIDARKWYAGKLNGKYSDKSSIDVTSGGKRLKSALSDAELEAIATGKQPQGGK